MVVINYFINLINLSWSEPPFLYNIQSKTHLVVIAIIKVKNDLINFREFKSDEKYYSWINEHKKILFDNKTKFDENNIYYDIKSNTKDYLKSIFYILIKFEKMNKIKIKNKLDYLMLFH